MRAVRVTTALLLVAASTRSEVAFAGESYIVLGSTGNLHYEYTFDVPPARGRYQPQLVLRYGGQQGYIGSNGATWGIPPVPVIRYDYIIDSLTALVYYFVDFRNPDKILLPSQRDGTSHYNADVEERYGDYWQPDVNTWCARDGGGNVYRFETSSPISQPGPGTYWALRQVVDPDGNVTKYGYLNINQVTSNVGKVSVDPDTNVAGDEYFESATFEVGFNAAAACKDCVREQTRTDPTKGAPNDRLEATYYGYGPTFQLTAVYRQAGPVLNPTNYLGTSSYPRVTSITPNPDGTVGSRNEGAVTTYYGYDSYRLRPTTVSVADTNSTLVTSTVYDDYGRPYSVSGPTVSGRTDPVPVKYYAYDALGRVKNISQLGMSGSLVLGATRAFEYAEYSGSTPASTKTYDFAVPTNYTDPSVPQTSDVRQTVSWVDALGREIQVRQRMGGSASGDPGAGITQNLSQYRVARAILYDGAGRMTASAEPFYSASGTFADLNAGIDAIAGQSVRVGLTSYDSQGRVTCSITRAASATIPTVGSCTSSFGEDSNYARATLTSYRVANVAGKNYLAVKTLPPENNYSNGSMVGPESFFDSAGLLRWTTDAEGNATRINYDLIGRQVKTSREMTTAYAGSLFPSGRPTTVDTTLTLDLMGRTVKRTDPNIGRRTFVFDDAVSSSLPTKMQFDKTGDEIRYGYDKGRPRTTTSCTNSGGTLTCVTDSTLTYDVPYQGLSSSYAFTAGRVAYATNANTAIAFGYDQSGSVVRRDQWLQGIAGGFGSLETPRLDGQSVASGLTTPLSSSSFATSYDSAARPVQLSSGAAVYWAATGSAATGAYDALGQPGSASLDAGQVTQAWIYGAASALLASESVRFGTAGSFVYSVGSMTYRGTKLTGFTDSTDPLSSTAFGYWYSNAGRLVAARATPSGTSPLAQNTLVCLSYSATKEYGSGPSLGNIERTREGVSSPSTNDFLYSGTNVEASVPPPHLGGPDAATSVGTSTLGYDDYGRVVSTGGGANTFAYDLLGRMTAITLPGGATEKLYYDPFGALVQRQVGTTVISYVGKRATVTGTLAAGCQTPSCGVVVSSVDLHVALGPRRVASVRVFPATSPRTLYYYRDRLGSVVATTRGGGLSGASYRYSAHGALEVAVGESSDSASEIGYTGALKLSGGLLSMGARVYNPALKMWMQPDPLQPFKYDYADGDPVNKVDPTGMLAGGDDAVAAWLANAAIESGMLGGAGGLGAGTVFSWAGGAGLAFGAGWLAGTWLNDKYLSGPIQNLLDRVLGPPGQSSPNVAGPTASRDSSSRTTPTISWPGEDPTVSPGEEWEWRGNGPPESGKGAWYNPETGESLHPDLNHPDPIGPHWDFVDEEGNKWRIYPSGDVVPVVPE